MQQTGRGWQGPDFVQGLRNRDGDPERRTKAGRVRNSSPVAPRTGYLFEQEPTRFSFYPLQRIFYVAKNFMAIKSCKGKNPLRAACLQQGAGRSSKQQGCRAAEAALKGDGPQDPRQLNVHPDPGPSRATGQPVHGCPTQMPSDGKTET